MNKPVKIRNHGVTIGRLPVGMKNCITDVRGVKVGHVTIDKPLAGGEYAATGVTAILPHGENLFRKKVIGASYVLNGFGKTTGLVQVDELGLIESPIMLTNTFGVPAVTQGTLQYMLQETPEIGDTTGTVNVVVGECNDSRLNSIRALEVQPSDAVAAIHEATTEPSLEGAVGAGKGMICFGYKGGIGTSSRVIRTGSSGKVYTIGCLVLSNFGSKEDFQAGKYQLNEPKETPAYPQKADGSIIIVLATDAPVDSRQLRRIAKRSGIGLGRTGSHFSHGSGDIVIAFTTANPKYHVSEDPIEKDYLLREDGEIMNELFIAATDVTEEAILNSMSQAVTTTGRKGNTVYAYPF